MLARQLEIRATRTDGRVVRLCVAFCWQDTREKSVVVFAGTDVGDQIRFAAFGLARMAL